MSNVVFGDLFCVCDDNKKKHNRDLNFLKRKEEGKKINLIHDYWIDFVEDLDGSDKRVMIVDCRSYRASMANRLKGGGVECVGQ